MVYLDQMGHLITDGPAAELHAFARALGLKREYYQDQKPGREHYDLTTDGIRARAIKNGAKPIDCRETVQILKQKGALHDGNRQSENGRAIGK